MKKILLFTSLLVLIFSNLQAQTLDSVVTTAPIVCFGDFATVTAFMTQTSTANPVKLMNYRSAGVSYYSYGSSGVTTGSAQPFTGMISTCYRMLMVDSTSFYTAFPGGVAPQSQLQNITHPSILDFVDYCVDGTPDIVVTNTQTAFNLCNGDCTAAENVVILGGTPPFSVTTNGIQSVLGINSFDTSYVNLCSDTYDVTVVDVNGCVSNPTITNFIISEPSELILNGSISSNYSGQDISCFGGSDGEITAVVSGGTSNYTYSIDGVNFSNNNVFTGLFSGSYTIYYLDANGCDTFETIILNDPPELSGSLTISQQINCNGVADGEIQFIVNNQNIGTPGYSYSIDNGVTYQNSNIFPGLLGNTTYTIIIKDANNCLASDFDFISEPTEIVFSASSTDFNGVGVTCNGATDGQIVIQSPTGGTPNYQYSITGGPPYSSTVIHNGIGAGIFVVMVIDANSCTNDTTITIIEPPIFTVNASAPSSYNGSNVSCYGICDGLVSVTQLNGVGSINYDMTSYSTQTLPSWTSVCGGLSFGAYTIDATDANGCTANTTITLTEPQLWVYVVDSIEETCDLGNGQASINVTQGGTGTLAYLWDDPTPQQITATAINLITGMYEVRVTDINGCTFTENIFVEEIDITLSFNSVPPCNGGNDGSATVIPNGTPPYSYQWFDNNGIIIAGATTNTISGLAPGFYSVSVLDAGGTGCSVTDTVEIATISSVDVTLDVANSMLDVACFGDSSIGVTVITTGGTGPNTYLYNIPNTSPSLQVSNTFSGLYVGNYHIYATDSTGCSDSVAVNISQPDSLDISFLTSDVLCNGGSTGAATVVTAGGTPNYFYNWINTSSNSNLNSNLIAGTYSVIVSDVNGCSKTSSIVINEPNALSASYITDSISCQGYSDGIATLLVSGGSSVYSYNWDNGSNINIANNLSAGYNMVTITDSSGCILIDSVYILEPSFSVKIDTLIISEITCHDANNASITVLATGGQHPYMYSSSNGLNQQSTIGFPNLGPNTYTIYVQDSKGCTDRDTIEIINPDSLYIDTTIFSSVQCYGLNNASIQLISAFGGTSPYEYSINSGAHYANMAYFNGYGPGTYNVQVFDVNNCAAQDIIIIVEPDELDVTIITSEWNSYQIKCYGDTSGFADITVNGGLSPYLKTVLDNNGDTVVSSYNSNILGLSVGIYTFLIMDANGCTYTETIIYNEPLAITHNFISTHVSCDGWNNGSLTDVVSGGVGASTSYIYAWNTGDSTYSLTSIPVGIYTMTVLDNNNCESVSSFTINDANALNITSTGTPVSCYDYCDGIIVANATGGMPNINSSGVPVYTYQWDDILSQTTASAIGLCVDNISNSFTYICTVTDGQGCEETIEYFLNQPEELIITASIVNEISCNLGNDGKLTATVTGGNGVGGTTYLWNTGTNFTFNPVNNNLSEGSYVVVAKDNMGCMDTTEIYLSEPLTALSVSLMETDVSCFGFDDGKVTATASGGTVIGIQKYNYNWTSGLNEQVVVSTAIDLAPNIYTVTVTDDKGCTITSETVYITEPANPLSIVVDSTDETCKKNNGIASAFVLGGTLPYTYAWNTGATTNPITDLSPALYTVNVRDKNGCTISSETFVNGVNNIFLPENVSFIDTSICLGRSVSLPIEVKPTLNYIWLYNTDTIYESTSVNYSDIVVTPTAPVNVYTLYITDPNCVNPYTVSATINVEFEDPLPGSNPGPVNGTYAIITEGESIEIFSNNMNCAIYQWSWIGDNPDLVDNIDRVYFAAQREIIDNPDVSGWYHIKVITQAGCEGEDSIYVVVGVGAPDIYDAITPNDDGKNDVWNIKNINSYPNAVIQIFNRWGSLVYETGGLNYEKAPWNGTRNGEELPVGTYYYIIDLNNNDEPQTGPITIIR